MPSVNFSAHNPTTGMVLECSSFRATPLGEGRFRLEIENAAPRRNGAFRAGEAAALLGELFGRPVSRQSLAYWRKNGMPHRQIGPRSFTYSHEDITAWFRGRAGAALQ